MRSLEVKRTSSDIHVDGISCRSWRELISDIRSESFDPRCMIRRVAARAKLPVGWSAKMYPACFWGCAPGHDGYPHAPVLITTIGLAGQFWVQANGASFDCSAMHLCSAQTVKRFSIASRRRWLWEVRDAAGVTQAWRQPGVFPPYFWADVQLVGDPNGTL
jgi:hypothetical protein